MTGAERAGQQALHVRVAQVGVRVPVERADSARLHEQRLGLVHERIALGRVAAALDAVEQRVV